MKRYAEVIGALCGTAIVVIILLAAHMATDTTDYTQTCHNGVLYKVSPEGAMYVIADEDGSPERCTAQ